ncbi:L-seryl-tRNA(Sec) kinase-like [Thalassophryne amazonica]|uniref:L-seryl-tRNA(Sec) kinase-like n=1 Tax=Thalassophryne amazonica TaxID=390379 RepID=UPI001472688B|nr:L-seryl-tRNA(Sec) kinase-like [Thalassophryne amazonica]
MSTKGCGSIPRRLRACLCVLCGLPAVGKSTLAQALSNTAAQRGWKTTEVCYDELISQHAFRPRATEDDQRHQTNAPCEFEDCDSKRTALMHTEWRSHRQVVLQYIEELLKKPEASVNLQTSHQINRASWEKCDGGLLELDGVDDSAPLLIVLDDNFYYSSMRYEVYQLARKHYLGFCQVYLQCAVESCMSRNHNRPDPVPTQVMLEMIKRLEPPNPKKNSWETNSISLTTTQNVSNEDVMKVMELISCAMSNPLSPVEDNTEQKEADRLKCSSSVVHQADQACRRLISEAMKTARENQGPPECVRTLAAQLNESKTRFLLNLRRQLLQDLSLTPEEDIDMENVVKRAVNVFDQEKRDILFRFKNKYS